MHIFLIELSIIPIKNKIANILLNLSLNSKYPKVVKENPKTQIVVIIKKIKFTIIFPFV